MQPTSSLPPPETAPERRERQLAMLHRLADLNMNAAEAAAERIADPDSVAAPDIADPTLSLARATRAITLVIALENRVAAGQLDRSRDTTPATAADPRRNPVRGALHQAANAETDGAARNRLRRAIDDRLDEELAADPDGENTAGDVLATLSEIFRLPIDPAQLPDELLRIPPMPRPTFRPNGDDRTPPWAPHPTDRTHPEPPDTG